jgi:hypothetical protein
MVLFPHNILMECRNRRPARMGNGVGCELIRNCRNSLDQGRCQPGMDDNIHSMDQGSNRQVLRKGKFSWVKISIQGGILQSLRSGDALFKRGDFFPQARHLANVVIRAARRFAAIQFVLFARQRVRQFANGNADLVRRSHGV